MVKMAVYTQKCEQKWLKINNSWGWIKDVLGGKKSKNWLGGGDYSGLENSGTMFLLNDQSSKILEKSFKSFRTVKQ